MLEDNLKKDSGSRFKQSEDSGVLSRLRRSALPYALSLAGLIAPFQSYAGPQKLEIRHDQEFVQYADPFDLYPKIMHVRDVLDDLNFKIGMKRFYGASLKDFVSFKDDYSVFFRHLEGLTKKKLGVKGFAEAMGIGESERQYVDDVDRQKELLEQVKPYILESARKYKIEASLIEKVIRHESGGNRLAIGNDYSFGVMQLQLCNCGSSELGPAINPFNAKMAIDRGTALLANYHSRCHDMLKRNPEMKDRFNAKELTLIANKMGINNVDSLVSSGNVDALQQVKAQYADTVLGQRTLLKYSKA